MSAQLPSDSVVLTPRELQAVRLLADGCTVARIATHLGISPHTVVTHIRKAYRKLDVPSAAAAVMRALQLGLFAAAPAPSHDRVMPHPMPVRSDAETKSSVTDS